MTGRDAAFGSDEARRRLFEVAARDEPLGDRMDRLLDLGVDYLDVDTGIVAEVDMASGNWEVVAAVGDEEHRIPEGFTAELANTVCRHAIERDHPLAIHDVAESDRIAIDNVMETFELSCYHGGAITVDEDVYGTVCFLDSDPRSEPFSEEETLFVDLAATLLGHAIQRHRHERHLGEQRRALARRSRRFESLIRASFDVVLRVAPGGTVEAVPQCDREMLGYEPEELVGTSYAELMATQDSFERATAGLRRVLEGEPSQELELEVLTRDDRTVTVDVRAAPVYAVDDGDAAWEGVERADEFVSTAAGGPPGAPAGEFERAGATEVAGPDDATEATERGDATERTEPDDATQATERGDTAEATERADTAEATERADTAEATERADGAESAEPGAAAATDVDPTDRVAPEPDGEPDVEAVTVVLRDATRRKRYEHLVSVLQRVLRHNVRNALNVVHGAAEEIEPRDEADRMELDRILGTCADLLALTEKAGSLEAVIGETDEPEPTDLGDLAHRVADRVRGRYPDATVDVEVRGDATAPTTQSLERAIEEVVENAAKHAGEAPHVSVTVTGRGDGVDVAVADDGPGLPEQERDVLTAGRETPLAHGEGLGHWFVYWIVTSLDGEVAVDVDDGTTVRLRLPAASASATDRLPDSS